ncbi:MAG: PAS domain-containing protein [Euryarchaeota archaeon]|nr:PAS domain-containing protein [Euryarchaeota archaeon]
MNNDYYLVGACETDDNLKILRCSSEFAKILNYSNPKELVGKSPFFGEPLSLSLKKTGYYSGPVVALSKTGETLYGEIEIEKNGARYIIKELKIKSVANKNFWETMFRNMPLPVMILSKEHIIVDMNDKMEELVGIKKEKLLGTKCHKLMHNTNEPPEECPLEEAKNKNLPHSLNIMDTVFGKFLIAVAKINDYLYAHYALREAAVLVEMQGRMMEFLKRYNRILLAATTITDEMLRNKNVDDVIQSIKTKLEGIEGFAGVGIYFFRDTEMIECFSSGIALTRNEIKRYENEKEIIKTIKGGDNYYIFPMNNAPHPALFILNMGNEELTNDEVRTILSAVDHFGEYISSKALEEKRARAYKYINDVINDFATMVDRIRNPLATILATAEIEIENEETRSKIMEMVEEIQEITKKIDEVWNKAENMRKYLE